MFPKKYDGIGSIVGKLEGMTAKEVKSYYWKLNGSISHL